MPGNLVSSETQALARYNIAFGHSRIRYLRRPKSEEPIRRSEGSETRSQAVVEIFLNSRRFTRDSEVSGLSRSRTAGCLE